MKHNFKSYLFLLLLTLLYLLSGLTLNYIYPSLLNINTLAVILAVFLPVSLLALVIFNSGIKNDPDRRILKTFLAISLKTVLCLAFALILFVGFKKKDSVTVILFFIIYLGFTLFVVFSMLNTLKKSH